MAVVLNREIARISQSELRERSSDWETPAGGEESAPHVVPPSFTYRGYGDPHWRGQRCYLIGPANLEEREIVLACGCRASVPWWTLEPVE
jgi:hypothetical protein